MEINQPAAKFQDMSIAPMHTGESGVSSILQ